MGIFGEKMSGKENELDTKIEELKQQKKELMVKEGKAYRCKECKKIEMKAEHFYIEGNEKEGLCYGCWSEKLQEKKRDKLMQIFKEAKIIDIVPIDSPQSDIDEVEKIVLDVNGEHYEVVSCGYREFCIKIQKEES